MDPSFFEFIQRLPRDCFADLNSLYSVPTEFYSYRIIPAWHPHIKNLPSESDVSPGYLSGSSPILKFHETPNHILRISILSDMEPQVILLENFWRI